MTSKSQTWLKVVVNKDLILASWEFVLNINPYTVLYQIQQKPTIQKMKWMLSLKIHFFIGSNNLPQKEA